MIAAWMVYCLALGVLLTGAGLLAERLVHEHGGATRRVWVLALAGAVVLPTTAVLLKDAPAAVEQDGALLALSPATAVVMEGVGLLSNWDGVLLLLWGGASTTLLVLLATGLTVSLVQRRSWREALVDGVPVLISAGVGPAVVGYLRQRIVLPAWVLEATEDERRVILRHEQEHLAAGDAHLTLFSAGMVVLMPWNVGLWYMARRLRLAVEVDCDRRVMRADDMDTRTYALLLLAVGRRRSVPAYAVGFSLGRPFLEQRIDRMTRELGGSRSARSAVLALGLAIVLAAAWAMPQPVRAADISNDPAECPLHLIELNRTLLELGGRAT